MGWIWSRSIMYENIMMISLCSLMRPLMFTNESIRKIIKQYSSLFGKQNKLEFKRLHTFKYFITILSENANKLMRSNILIEGRLDHSMKLWHQEGEMRYCFSLSLTLFKYFGYQGNSFYSLKEARCGGTLLQSQHSHTQKAKAGRTQIQG
jgi:hypothetical protein